MNDLSMIEEVKKFRNVNSPIANAVLEKFRLHYWYLSDILLGLTFFDKRHSPTTLSQMVKSLDNPGNDSNLFRNTTKNFEENLNLKDLINKNTRKFFDIVGNGDVDFLLKDPLE